MLAKSKYVQSHALAQKHPRLPSRPRAEEFGHSENLNSLRQHKRCYPLNEFEVAVVKSSIVGTRPGQARTHSILDFAMAGSGVSAREALASSIELAR